MRTLHILTILFTAISCRSTSPFITYSGDVSIQGTNATLSSSSNFFSVESVNKADSIEMIDERADHYLNLILEGYYQQTGHFNFTNDKNAPMYFDVQHVSVKTGYFSFNLVDPGPIYKMRMEVDIYSNGELLGTETYKTRVNMAQVINPEKMWNWLTLEEKNDSENQLTTFDIGLRSLYRNLFFKHLDISLSL